MQCNAMLPKEKFPEAQFALQAMSGRSFSSLDCNIPQLVVFHLIRAESTRPQTSTTISKLYSSRTHSKKKPELRKKNTFSNPVSI